MPFNFRMENCSLKQFVSLVHGCIRRWPPILVEERRQEKSPKNKKQERIVFRNNWTHCYTDAFAVGHQCSVVTLISIILWTYTNKQMCRMLLRVHAVRRAMTKCPNAGKNNTAMMNNEGVKIWRRQTYCYAQRCSVEKCINGWNQIDTFEMQLAS
uniref:Uncharacterized protein n=1 Tax=Trichuris muris TaxID=70415 RepID=A0A5S6QYA2_TRIMR